MFMIVKVPVDGNDATAMRDILTPGLGNGRTHYASCECPRLCDIGNDSYAHKLMLERPEFVAGAETVIRKLMEVKKDVPFAKELLNGLYGVNSLRGAEHRGEPDPRGHDAVGSENVKDESRDIFITVNSDHVSPETMHEIAKLIAELSGTDRDIHVNII